MPNEREIRADYDRDTIVVYQAYSTAIAGPALEAQRFVAPFSFKRMTWIKPSFLWLMHRSHWGQKAGQERTLAVRIGRTGWQEALSLAVLTAPDRRVFPGAKQWQQEFRQARVVVQWDPERSLRGAALPYSSIQVGLSRHVIRRFAEEWVVNIVDYSPLVTRIYHLLQSGHPDRARWLLPPERAYPIDEQTARRIEVDR